MSDTPVPPVAGDALHALRAGTLGSEELTRGCLDAIRQREPAIQAFAHLDTDAALAAARAMDVIEAGQRGPMHGLPIGVKDVIETSSLPTEYGCAFRRGHRPTRDARCLENLQRAGAVVLGKTVTTEYALLEPSRTYNPLSPDRTPGGSSAGSAAAVAAGMVPVALGTQTNASTIRPASYCGVYGYKPTFGSVPTTGVACIAPTLDTVGFFSRDLTGLAETAMHAAEPGSHLANGALLADLAEAQGRRWRVGLVHTAWDALDNWVPGALDGFNTTLERHARLQELALPAAFEDIYTQHMLIQDAGAAAALGEEFQRQPALFSDSLRRNVERGQQIDAAALDQALAFQARMRSVMDARLAEVDVVITAAATGEAPTRETTGNPVMCTPWTFIGAPTLSVPLFTGPNGLPLGLQIIAARGNDAALFAFAASLPRLAD